MVSHFDMSMTVYLTIWDNSGDFDGLPLDYEIAGSHAKTRVRVTPENWPLNKVYNKFIADESGSDVLIILDQDSRLEPRFLDKAMGVHQKYDDIACAVPIVRSHGELISPGYYFYFKGFPRRTIAPGKYEPKTFTAIMSGVCFSGSWIRKEKVEFPAEIKFYGLDVWLFRELFKRDSAICVLNSEIGHDSAIRNRSQYNAWRLESQIEAWRYNNRRLDRKIVTEAYIIYRKLMFSLRGIARD